MPAGASLRRAPAALQLLALLLGEHRIDLLLRVLPALGNCFVHLAPDFPLRAGGVLLDLADLLALRVAQVERVVAVAISATASRHPRAHAVAHAVAHPIARAVAA